MTPAGEVAPAAASSFSRPPVAREVSLYRRTVGAGETHGILRRSASPLVTVLAPVGVPDPLPAGITPTSATGTGWGPGLNACSVGGQTVTCTRSNVLAPNTSYPPITIAVSIAPTAPSPATNTAVVSGGGETNTADDTATDVANVLPPTDADMTITKTASASTVTQGSTFTYTRTVTNNATAPAT